METAEDNGTTQMISDPPRAASSPSQENVVPDFDDKAVLRSRGMEKTKNRTGFMFLRIHEPTVRPWLTSLPDSGKPIADLGACYGVHTIHAMKYGRDVIAVDADAQHIGALRERASKIETPGRLLEAIVAKLPCGDMFEESCFAGVLLSEVLPYLPLGGPKQLFQDVYKWLLPGGILVVTCMSPFVLGDGRGRALRYNGDISYDRALELFKNVPENIVQLAPGYVELSPEWKGLGIFPDFLYIMTREEVRAFAEMAGFVIETCEYCPSAKYMMDRPSNNESVKLIAKKPIISSGVPEAGS